MEPIPVPLLDTSEERRLFEVIKRLIMKDPLDRYQDADGLLKALEGQPRESVAQRRVSAAQAIMAVQSTTPLPAQSIALSPRQAGPAVRPVVPPTPPSTGVTPDTPRRPVMRRSTVTPQPPSANWVPWLLALLAVIGFGAGASYLYTHGLLGGSPAPDTLPAPPPPVPDTSQAVQPDSEISYDSAMLAVDLFNADSLIAHQATPPRTAPITQPRGPEPVSGDSGVLQFTSLPPRTQVFIDGRPVTQPGAGIRLPAGWHELGVSAPGFLLFTDSVKIEAARTLVVSPNLSPSNSPAPAAGSPADMRRRVLARLDCDNPGPVNRFGALCYDTRPQPLGPNRVRVPDGIEGIPSNVVLVVKVSRQGRTLALKTRVPSNEPAFTRAVEEYAQTLRWTPAMREGQPVDGWTQAAFVPDTP
jgi:hypothetical protein